jgi:hypothetical protein
LQNQGARSLVLGESKPPKGDSSDDENSGDDDDLSGFHDNVQQEDGAARALFMQQQDAELEEEVENTNSVVASLKRNLRGAASSQTPNKPKKK